MAARGHSLRNAIDTSLRAFDSNEQVDVKSVRLGLPDQIGPIPAGKCGLDRKAQSLVKVIGRPLEHLTPSGDGCSQWVRRIQLAGDRIGMQPVTTFEVGESRNFGLSAAVGSLQLSLGSASYRYAAFAFRSRIISSFRQQAHPKSSGSNFRPSPNSITLRPSLSM